ncbi:MAG: Mov34/MPN/PAD-1 family protein [Promethearchaeota archaeon]|jgi:hypothetical protein
MPKIFCDVIQNQAISSENEIYGWLIGFQKNDVPTVLAIIECNRFEQQTLISAIPHAQEFQEISSIMPQGIGPIGIYHSHPLSSEVFHSHTDDKTLISLSNQFPHAISLVTNGKETNYYQMNDTKEIHEIEIHYSKPQPLGFILIAINEELEITADSRLLNDESYITKLRIKILNKTKQKLEDFWENLEFYQQTTLINELDLIEPYIVDKLYVEPIQIKIPENLKPFKISITEDDRLNDNDYRSTIKLRLITKIPIYITDRKKIFSEIKQAIKTELVSNNILQKIYYSVLDAKNNSIILPNDYNIRFFGFFLRFLYFNRSALNEKEIAMKNFEFLMKLFTLFRNFSGTEIDTAMRNFLKSFMVDIERFSTNFSWQNKFKKILKNFKKKI